MATIIGTWNADTIAPGLASPGVTGGVPGDGDDSIIALDGSDSVGAGGGNDTIGGGSGDDTLDGGAGDDSLAGGGGRDMLTGGEGRDTLDAEYGGRTLDGGAGDDSLVAGIGSHTLAGGEGRDTMSGGAGDDIYIVDTPGDLVFEALGEGGDTVQTTLADYTAPANVEVLVGLAGTGQRLVGNAQHNILLGGLGGDTLLGGSSFDILDGGGGADRMVGGADSDMYFVNAAGDRVIEGRNGGAWDSVYTTLASYTLPANVEELYGIADAYPLTPPDGPVAGSRLVGNALANVIGGGDGVDTLVGGRGADRLHGSMDEGYWPYTGGVGVGASAGRSAADAQMAAAGRGGDRLLGGSGDDLYIIDADDVVLEAPGGGHDTVRLDRGTGYTLPHNVEVLVLDVGTRASSGTGNALGNILLGDAQDNTLSGLAGADSIAGGAGTDLLLGGDGADTLTGGLGADTFTGGSGGDRFVVDLDVNRIADFTFRDGDRILLTPIDANALWSGDQAFTWIGSDEFAGTGATSAGQLRMALLAPGQWRAQGDVDGNGLADLQIDIASTAGPGVGKGWFIL